MIVSARNVSEVMRIVAIAILCCAGFRAAGAATEQLYYFGQTKHPTPVEIALQDHEPTGSNATLTQAEISSFSGELGRRAMNANTGIVRERMEQVVHTTNRSIPSGAVPSRASYSSVIVREREEQAVAYK